jgi:protein O-mannosyl-transferase
MTDRGGTRGTSVGIAALALVASITSLTNGFALDDVPIVALDPRAHNLAGAWRFCCTSYWPRGYGGGLYRPLTSMLFALEWAIGHGAPIVFHAINIGLYAVLAVAVLALAREVLDPAPAALTAALFAVHPAHVEVVANVVGQSELVAALAMTLAVAIYVRARRTSDAPLGRGLLGAIGALFAAAILAKEHGVVLPLVLLAAECIVVRDPRPLRARARTLWPLAATLAAVGVGYGVARLGAIGWLFGDTPNPALASLPPSARGWTMLAVAGEWLRLLLWPAHLAALYGPPGTPILKGFDWRAMGCALAVGAVLVLAFSARRRVPVITFGIVWAGLALLPVTNLVFVSGVHLAERSLFFPSVGAMLAVGGAVGAVVGAAPRRWLRITAMATASVLVGLGVWRSARRQPVWRDNRTLLVQAVQDEPNSYVAHYQLAGQLFADGLADAGEREVNVAIAQSNGFPPALAMLAQARARNGDCASAVPLWRRALAQFPRMVPDRLGLATCLLEVGDYAGARSVAVVGVSEGAWVHTFRVVIASADSAAATAADRSVAVTPPATPRP